MQPDPYIEKQDEGYRIAGSRVSLDSIVYAFRNGQSADFIMRRQSPGVIIVAQQHIPIAAAA